MTKPLWLRVSQAIVVSLTLVWSLVPVLFAVTSSFKDNREIFDYPPRILFAPTLAHYSDLFVHWPTFAHNLTNSLIITVAATALAIGASALAGYVYSRYRGSALASSAYFMIGIRLLPPIVVTLPLFPAIDYLGLSDTYYVLILLYAAFFVSLGTMIMKTFIDGVPEELDHAAVIDGASEVQILWRVILPLAAQGMMAVAVFVFVYSWNEYLFAFIFTTTQAKTGPVIISEMMSSLTGVDWGVLFAAITIQLVPVVAFVVLAQRFLVAGLTAGAVKS
jgi:multiple sugar transport system permease protein